MRLRHLAVLLSAALTLSGTTAACGAKSSRDSGSGKAGSAGPLDPNTKVTITVGCQPRRPPRPNAPRGTPT
ncbi:hypothetical protein [Actinomadura sp. J1-007]|uniref:hypothetical protein n=1 Tax=Actinomadura sp. J1-007 TaxID=2661913 RepID=UPI0019D69A87|nr:hypothetical protein [Actinomadura sp. J1-007]